MQQKNFVKLNRQHKRVGITSRQLVTNLISRITSSTPAKVVASEKHMKLNQQTKRTGVGQSLLEDTSWSLSVNREMSIMLEGSVEDQLSNDPCKHGFRRIKRNPKEWKAAKVSRASAQGVEYINRPVGNNLLPPKDDKNLPGVVAKSKQDVPPIPKDMSKC
ncbi:hypothetical protein RRG08_006845 [Elysia crispata]|uniref:Uncharacterized protein n=1 Tax=Elysia crispata TaxID=231223 RepID=A0AAE1CNI9_9GAST|nr:hypothetical protein RRG08_006845 [Elysia crispata]